MAHISALTGGVSESLASAIFLNEGYSVFTAIVPENYDLIVTKNDENGVARLQTVQVKTIKIRRDRNGEIVVKGANNNGLPYPKSQVSLIAGINLETNKMYLIENNEQTEYWSKDEATARKKWKELSLEKSVVDYE